MSSYAADFQDETGAVRLSGTLDFTDPDNQPAGVNQPFQPTAGDVVTIVEDAAGDPVYQYDDDASSHDFTGGVSVSGQLGASGVLSLGDVTAQGGTLDGAALGPTIPYVTVQSGPPSTYQTPLVFDSTAVSGGLYAWDGSAYQQVGGPLA